MSDETHPIDDDCKIIGASVVWKSIADHTDMTPKQVKAMRLLLRDADSRFERCKAALRESLKADADADAAKKGDVK
jgi:hypothetical protein